MLAVDGNSLIHRAFHASNGSLEKSSDGSANGALKGVWNQLTVAAERVEISAVRIAFDSPNTARKQEFAEYKSQRGEKPQELIDQLKAAKAHFESAGFHVVQLEGQEADDILASTAATNSAAGWDTVVVTSDRDSFSLINDDVRVLRVMNGGMATSPLLDREALIELVGVAPEHYQLFAAMRGDPSDNLNGVNGIGPATACKIINAIAERGDPTELLLEIEPPDAIELFGKSAGSKITATESRATLARNLKLMKLRTDLPVGSPDQSSLPLDESTLLHVLNKWNMSTVSARALSSFCPLRLSGSAEFDHAVRTVALDDVVDLVAELLDDPDPVDEVSPQVAEHQLVFF